jgi:integrase
MTHSSFQRGYVSGALHTHKGTAYVIRYRVRKADGSWTHKAERLYGLDGKKAARAVLDQRVREASKQSVFVEDLTVQAFVDQYWKAYLDRLGAKPSTRKSYGSILKNVLPSLGQLKLAHVTPLHIEQVLQDRIQKVTAKTLLNEIGLLQSIFTLAVENDLLDRSPVRSKHKPKIARSEKPIWTPEQVKLILLALPENYRPLFTCAACTGVRVGELLALSWSDLNFEEQTISIRKSLWGKQVVRPKTDASVRTLYAGPMLMDVLRIHRSRSPHCKPSDWVFCNSEGQPWNADVLRRDVLYPVLDRLQLTRAARSSGFHCFRHSAGSFVNSQTGNLKLAQKLLGHSRYETTANVYTHALSGEERAAALAVEEAIFGSCSQLFPNENNKRSKSVN